MINLALVSQSSVGVEFEAEDGAIDCCCYQTGAIRGKFDACYFSICLITVYCVLLQRYSIDFSDNHLMKLSPECQVLLGDFLSLVSHFPFEHVKIIEMRATHVKRFRNSAIIFGNNVKVRTRSYTIHVELIDWDHSF